MPHPLTIASSVLLLSASLAAQDLLAVTWAGGNIARIDSTTGVATIIGSSGGMHNSLARDGNGVFWSVRATGSFPYSLAMSMIDPNLGTATDMIFGAPDLRGLAGTGSQLMYGVCNTVAGSISSIDTLVLVDLAAGTFTTIGPTNMTALQGLAMHQGTLYAWDLNLGLVIVDPLTGAATDPFPGVAGFNGQGLCSHPDGRLIVGGPTGLNSIDPATGAATLIAAIAGLGDLRGIEAFGGYATPFGQGCNGAFGTVSMTVTGNLGPGGTLTSTSNNHAASSFGILIFGLSTTHNLGLPLPLSMDPILGTVGCNLFVSIDATLSAFTGAGSPANLTFSFGLTPATANAVFHLQHACFEPVTGGASFSNGVTVNVGP